jgi:hypothetical protein
MTWSQQVPRFERYAGHQSPSTPPLILALTLLGGPVDVYTIVGFRLFFGLALTAALVVLLVLVADIPWWAGLLLLAVLDAIEIAWAYIALRRIRLAKR